VRPRKSKGTQRIYYVFVFFLPEQKNYCKLTGPDYKSPHLKSALVVMAMAVALEVELLSSF
jgi:hypothetical protein